MSTNSLGSLFGAIANAIRSKTGSEDAIIAADFPAAIRAIPPVAVVTNVAIESNYVLVAAAGEGQDFSQYNNAAIICKDNAVDISQYPFNGYGLTGATFSKRSTPSPGGYAYDASVTSIYNRESVRLSTTLANIDVVAKSVKITFGGFPCLRTSGAYCVILWRE